MLFQKSKQQFFLLVVLQLDETMCDFIIKTYS